MKIDRAFVYKVDDFSYVSFNNLNPEISSQIRSWRNHPEIRRVMYNTEEITEEQHEKFINNLLYDDSRFYWLVYREGAPIGVLNIVDVDYNKGSCQLGYYLLPSLLNSGIGVEFVSKGIYFIFHELGLSSIFGRTEINNRNALFVNYYLGFKVRPNLVMINDVRYVEQDCYSNVFFQRYEKNISLNKMSKKLKEFNQIYKELL